MSNPYLIQGPAQISFSGGRSSGMMLCKIVEAHGGTLPDDVIVSFANTGKEREETLRFVDDCARHLGITVHWLEWWPVDESTKLGGAQKDRWKAVNFETASRNGEPFAELIRRATHPPTVVTRMCTAELKTKPIHAHMRSLGFGLPRQFITVAGIRSDEPRRVAKMRKRQDIEFALPLADAGETKETVAAFWQSMPFDLALPSFNGETLQGNCDLCYLKSTAKMLRIIREEPFRADWWIAQEAGGKLFRIDRPNYAALKVIALQPQFDFEPQEESLPCECTD